MIKYNLIYKVGSNPIKKGGVFMSYKKIMGGMLLATFLLAGTVNKDVKKKIVTEPEGVTTLNFELAAPPVYSTNFTYTYVDTMPNQYSTLYTAEKPINTSPDQTCVFAAFRRYSDDANYQGSGWVALIFSNDGGNTWNRVWPINDDGGGRYPQVGPWMGNCDTFIVSYANVSPGYGASIATVPSDGDLNAGNILKYYYATTPFVGFQSFADASNDMANYVNWMIGADNNYQTHWWWRFGFIDPDPPNVVIPNSPGGVWNTDYLNGTYAALVFPQVYFSYDDGATWSDSAILNSNIPIDTTQDGHIVDAIWYTNWWDFALLNDSTPIALIPTTAYFTDPYILGTDTLFASEGLYLVTPDTVYTVVDPDEGFHIVNNELTIDHARNVLYVTYVAYHTLDWVGGSRFGWTDIYVKYSTDGGATWSAPINITRDEANQPTDDKIEQQVHTVKHIWGGDKLWMLFNVPVGWDGALAGFDIHYDVWVNGGVTPSYIMVGYIPLLGVEESATPRVSIAGLKFNGNVVKNGLLKFFSPVNGKVSFELFDVNGRKVYSRNITVKTGNNELRLNDLNLGVYFLKYTGTAKGSVKLVFTK